MGGGRVIEIKSQADWDKALSENASATVIVDFTATWCGPCQMIGPVFVKLSSDPKYASVVFLKVDVDEVQAVSQACGITAMPTFQVYKNGQKVDEMVGADPKRLETMLGKHA